MIAFSIPGQPTAKGRPRFAQRGRFMSAYTPAETRNAEAFVKLLATQAMAGRAAYLGPLSVALVAWFEVPASASKKRKAAMLDQQVFPVGKPDADNLLKLYGDALNGIVWKDDSQIVRCSVRKVYGTPARVELSIVPLDEAEQTQVAA